MSALSFRFMNPDRREKRARCRGGVVEIDFFERALWTIPAARNEGAPGPTGCPFSSRGPLRSAEVGGRVGPVGFRRTTGEEAAEKHGDAHAPEANER